MGVPIAARAARRQPLWHPASSRLDVMYIIFYMDYINFDME